MDLSRRHVACALLVLAFAAPVISQAPAPKAPPAPPPAPAAPDIKRLASEVWVYAFPLVLTDVTREVQSAGTAPNTLKHRRTLPDTSTTEPNANADFLYSQAWLDLSKGPIILTVPDTKGRYYLLA